MVCHEWALLEGVMLTQHPSITLSLSFSVSPNLYNMLTCKWPQKNHCTVVNGNALVKLKFCMSRNPVVYTFSYWKSRVISLIKQTSWRINFNTDFTWTVPIMLECIWFASSLAKTILAFLSPAKPNHYCELEVLVFLLNLLHL